MPNPDDEVEGTRDLKKKNQAQAENAASTANSSTSLAWYRGHQSGVFDASKALEEIGHRGIAKKLRAVFLMDENGTIHGVRG